MAREMADLGFTHIELSHGIRITLVPGILKALGEGWVKISSTHNFCPLPTGVTRAAPNLYEPSSLDPAEIDQWARHTRRSIDFAAQVGAGVLVCHLGSVPFRWFNPASRLARSAERHRGENLQAQSRHQAVLANAVARMRSTMPPYWAQVRAGIDSVLAYAAEKDVRLGFENRERFDELPLEADFPEFLASFPEGAPVGYWHDTGHAELKQRLGVIEQRTLLERMAPRLLGFHLHDVDAEGHDHQAIGSGSVRFEDVAEFFRPGLRLTIELSPRASRDDVVRSREEMERRVSAMNATRRSEV